MCLRLRPFIARSGFCLAAAVTAAAAIDPAMERLSNAGVFGSQQFTDHSTIDVIPALAAGLALALLVVFGLVRRTLRRSGTAPAWLRNCAPAPGAHDLPRLLPVIFALQLGALWSMETIEQIAVLGHPLAGAIWLGGPIGVSLALHAAGGIAVTLLLARMVCWSASTIAGVVTFIRQLFYTRVRTRAILRPCNLDVAAFRFLEPLLDRISGRAPPFSFA